jgi:hypothetical protein
MIMPRGDNTQYVTSVATAVVIMIASWRARRHSEGWSARSSPANCSSSCSKCGKGAADTYVRGAFFESPLTLMTRTSPRATRLFRFPRPGEVIRAHDLQSEATSLYKHAPPTSRRADLVTWQDAGDVAVKAAVKITQRAFRQLCFLLCDVPGMYYSVSLRARSWTKDAIHMRTGWLKPQCNFMLRLRKDPLKGARYSRV